MLLSAGEIIGSAAVIPNSERFCVINAIAKVIKNHNVLLV
jgi:hypothetical protein